MKKVIKLTESQLSNIIKKVVKKTLNETMGGTNTMDIVNSNGFRYFSSKYPDGKWWIEMVNTAQGMSGEPTLAKNFLMNLQQRWRQMGLEPDTIKILTASYGSFDAASDAVMNLSNQNKLPIEPTFNKVGDYRGY